MDFLKQALANYPFVTNTELETLQEQLDRREFDLKEKKQRSHKKKLSPADQKLLNDLSAINAYFPAILDLANERPQNLFILMTKCQNVASISQLNHWLTYLEEALAHETDKLAVISSFQITNPVQFAGFVLYLLNHEIKENQILSSGLLHRYFKDNQETPDKVRETYELIKFWQGQNKQARTFIEKLGKIAVDETHPQLKNMTLDGQDAANMRMQTVRDLQELTPDTLLSCVDTFENLHNLYALFEMPFLLKLLQYLIEKPHDIFYQFLGGVFQQMPFETLKSLYEWVLEQPASIAYLTVLSEVELLKPLVNLGQDAIEVLSLTDEHQNNVFHLLAYGTESLFYAWLQQCSELPLHPVLMAQNEWGETVVHLLARDHSLEIEWRLLLDIDSPNALATVMKMGQYRDQWTPMHYLAQRHSGLFRMVIEHLLSTARVEVVSQPNDLGDTPLHILAKHDRYALSAIMEHYFPIDNTRMALLQLLNEDKESVLATLCSGNLEHAQNVLLKFKDERTRIKLALEGKNPPIYRMMLLGNQVGYLLANCFYDKHIVKLLNKKVADEQNLLHIALHNRDKATIPMLLHVLKRYPTDLWKLITHPDGRGDTVLHQAARYNTRALIAIVQTLSQAQLSEAMVLKNHVNETFLHILADASERTPHDQQMIVDFLNDLLIPYSVLVQQDMHGNTLLHMGVKVSQPASFFAAVLKDIAFALKQELFFKLNNQGHTIFKRIIFYSTPQLYKHYLDEFFAEISLESDGKLVQLIKDTIPNHPEYFAILLQKYSEHLRLAFLIKHHLLADVVKHSEILEWFLNNIPVEDRMPALSLGLAALKSDDVLMSPSPMHLTRTVFAPEREQHLSIWTGVMYEALTSEQRQQVLKDQLLENLQPVDVYYQARAMFEGHLIQNGESLPYKERGTESNKNSTSGQANIQLLPRDNQSFIPRFWNGLIETVDKRLLALAVAGMMAGITVGLNHYRFFSANTGFEEMANEQDPTPCFP